MATFLRVLWLPAAVVALVLGWLWLDADMGWRGIYLPRVGITLIVVGALLSSWCAAIFLFLGKGSPHPFVKKTKHLVTTGPYGVVRNPMMWGIGTLLVGLALALGSVGLWFGFAFFLLFVRWFVANYEEPDMERRFGEDYREYCRQTPRWWPLHRRKKPA